MASRVDLGNLEQSIERLVASGRYSSKSEVLREGVRLVEEREKRLEALNAALASGIADADAGRVKSVSTVFDRLTAKYESLARAKGE
jgi:antitoxin ParD1/3/4